MRSWFVGDMETLNCAKLHFWGQAQNHANFKPSSYQDLTKYASPKPPWSPMLGNEAIVIITHKTG